MPVKKEKLTELWIDKTDIGWSGITQYTAWKRGYPCPVGVVWCMCSGNRETSIAQVWHSYTLPYFRRRGIRAALNKEILKTNQVIITGGPKDSLALGRKFMKAQGYKYNPQIGLSYLKRPRKKP